MAIRFTVTETRVLNCLVKGMSNKAIAHELGVADGTIKRHLVNCTKKLGFTNRVQLAIWWHNYLTVFK
jgi:two-component system, NarL family, nitrate/nitrite response regulator NarL